jgi:hypothetical protein
MIRVDHISMAVQNVYEAANRLREETGLGFYDGGWSTAGLASRIFPLGPGCYLQMEGIVDATALTAQKTGALRLFHEQTAKGDCLRGFAMGTGTLAELEAVGARLKLPVTSNPTAGRMLPDGERLVVSGVGSVTQLWPKGLPNWNYFPEATRHPSGQPVVPVPGLVKPLGLAGLELGGDERAMAEWIGVAPASLKMAFDGKGPGVRGFGVQTERGVVWVRRRSVNDA